MFEKEKEKKHSSTSDKSDLMSKAWIIIVTINFCAVILQVQSLNSEEIRHTLKFNYIGDNRKLLNSAAPSRIPLSRSRNI